MELRETTRADRGLDDAKSVAKQKNVSFFRMLHNNQPAEPMRDFFPIIKRKFGYSSSRSS